MSAPTLPKENGAKSETSMRLVRYLSDQPDWESYNDDKKFFVQQLPKIQLHVHLDGSFDPDFLWKYMKECPDDDQEIRAAASKGCVSGNLSVALRYDAAIPGVGLSITLHAGELHPEAEKPSY
jgi:hypothetical protein